MNNFYQNSKISDIIEWYILTEYTSKKEFVRTTEMIKESALSRTLKNDDYWQPHFLIEFCEHFNLPADLMALLLLRNEAKRSNSKLLKTAIKEIFGKKEATPILTKTEESLVQNYRELPTDYKTLVEEQIKVAKNLSH